MLLLPKIIDMLGLLIIFYFFETTNSASKTTEGTNAAGGTSKNSEFQQRKTIPIATPDLCNRDLRRCNPQCKNSFLFFSFR